MALKTLQSVPDLYVKQPFDQYFSTSGIQKARVLPDPVKSLAITSCPE